MDNGVQNTSVDVTLSRQTCLYSKIHVIPFTAGALLPEEIPPSTHSLGNYCHTGEVVVFSLVINQTIS